MIIGLTGPNASGKGEVAKYLKSKGFRYHSLSDVVRIEVSKMGLGPTRQNLIEAGNKLRKEFGPAVLAERIIPNLKDKDIADSIRTLEEIRAFRRFPDFILWGIDAPVKLRFERARLRRRPGEARTISDFMKKEEQENADDPNAQQLNRCLAMADILIINDSSLEKLYKKIEEALEKTKKDQAQLG